MPLQATSGAASYDAFGGGTVAKVNYIEDFFQSYLRTGTGASATVTTGLDGSTKETLVWTKSRSAATAHKLTDNVRGATKALSSNTTSAEATDSQGLTAFSATGYTIGTNTDYNNSGATYVDWQWVSQPKFFDVVTYTGTGSARTVAHNLGSVPGCIIIKNLTDADGWLVYHRSIGATKTLSLNTTGAEVTNGNLSFNDTEPTSTVFTVNTAARANQSGNNYVAYLFAHNAGGFGLTGTDNVISCGSATGDPATYLATVNLGWEPQWVLTKSTTAAGNWQIIDNMRGMTVLGSVDAILYPNSSSAESSTNAMGITSTGFITENYGAEFIYIAIRRGPMKVPTSGTSVFSPIVATNSQGTENTTGFPLDMQIANIRSGYASNGVVPSRLTGVSSNTTSSGSYLRTPSTNAEQTGSDITQYWGNTGFQTSSNWAGSGMVYWNFKRAPSFFDEVCYTGTGGASQTFTHNLGVAPELVIVKNRSDAAAWESLGTALTASQRQIYLNRTQAGVAVASGHLGWNGTDGAYKAPTSTLVYFGGDSDVGGSGLNYVAYLFATCAGVSKVGSYTGNGSSQTINCGFTGGARFVLIKRTDSTGDWMVSDSARGIVSGNDPYLELNNTNAEVTGEDWLDTDSTGFVVNEVSGSNANTNGASYIFLAIA